MNIPQETIDKIQKEARDYALNLSFPIIWSSEKVEGARNDAATDYEKGATEWVGKAQPVIDISGEIIGLLDPTRKYVLIPTETITRLYNALAKYKEVTNG